MSGSDQSAALAIALARVEVQLSHVVSQNARQEEQIEKLHKRMDAVQTRMDQGTGGMRVLQWLGFGSLASFLAIGAIVWNWLYRP